jgi:hypothetical protein
MRISPDNKIVWYIRNMLVGIDQLVNTLFGGDPDETLSSRMGKSQCRVCRLICRLLHFLEPKHCEKSIELDEGSRGVF